MRAALAVLLMLALAPPAAAANAAQRVITLGGSQYQPQGVVASSTATANKGSALTGVVDGKSGVVSAWVKMPNGGSTRYLFAVASGTVPAPQLFFNTTNAPRLSGSNSAGTQIYQGAGSVNLGTQIWYHLLWSWNLATARNQFALNDVIDTALIATTTNDVINYSVNGPWIASNQGGGSNFNDQTADVQVWLTGDLDIGVQANRRLFIDGVGRAVDPRWAEMVLGQPVIKLVAPSFSTFYNNVKGTGGTMTLGAGTFSQATSNPP